MGKNELVKEAIEAEAQIEPVHEEPPFKNQFDIASMLETAGTIQINEEQVEILYAPIEEDQIQIRPDGIVYMPWVNYAKRLRKAFGLQFSFVPQGMPQVRDNMIYWGFWLIIQGKIIGYAMGEQAYHPANRQMTYGDAIEGAKSNARMRVCKDVGMFPELWQPEFIQAWKEKYAVSCQERGRTFWKKRGVNGTSVPPDEGPPNNDFLVMGSDLHKALEAMIADEGWDRDLIHQYLLEKGAIDLVGGEPSFKAMTRKFTQDWLDKRQEFSKSFAAWCKKIAEPQE
jgi:hypothetical protein